MQANLKRFALLNSEIIHENNLIYVTWGAGLGILYLFRS
jgi:hypothetical protein